MKLLLRQLGLKKKTWGFEIATQSESSACWDRSQRTLGGMSLYIIIQPSHFSYMRKLSLEEVQGSAFRWEGKLPHLNLWDCFRNTEGKVQTPRSGTFHHQLTCLASASYVPLCTPSSSMWTTRVTFFFTLILHARRPCTWNFLPA